MSTDYDSPWKEALDVYFEPFLALLFPEVHRGIDWSRTKAYAVGLGGLALNLEGREGQGIVLSQLVTDLGRTRNLVAGSRAAAQAAETDYQYTRAGVLLDVDRAYFDALAAQALLRVAQQTVHRGSCWRTRSMRSPRTSSNRSST